MKMQIETHPNRCVRTFRSEETPLSQSNRTFFFDAPLPSFLREPEIRHFRLIGAVGERLVRALCWIPGVSQVFLNEHYVLVILRENSNLPWGNLEPKMFNAFNQAFPSTNFEWSFMPAPASAASTSASVPALDSVPAAE